MDNKKNISASKENPTGKSGLVFGSINYLLMAISLIILVIGFALMGGKTDIYNTTKISTAPIVVILGFGVGMVAIFYKGNKSAGE
jgi:hypothetical protein